MNVGIHTTSFENYGIDHIAFTKIIKEFYSDSVKTPIEFIIDGRLTRMWGYFRYRGYTNIRNIKISGRFGKIVPWHFQIENYYATVDKLSVFFHIIAHEMQHAIQYNDWNVNNRKYTVIHNIDPNLYTKLFKDRYFHNPIEADAEYAARDMGPVLRERYRELTGV